MSALKPAARDVVAMLGCNIDALLSKLELELEPVVRDMHLYTMRRAGTSRRQKQSPYQFRQTTGATTSPGAKSSVPCKAAPTNHVSHAIGL